jgi:hypothetical protein
MGHVDFSDLKLKLMASIAAISAIQVLESFMNVAQLSDRELAWSIGIHMSFVASGVLLAAMDCLSSKTRGPPGAPSPNASVSSMTYRHAGSWPGPPKFSVVRQRRQR